MTGSGTTLAAHPCFDRCFRIYLRALTDWNRSGALQQAARTLGMDRRAYADARLSGEWMDWLSDGSGDEFTRAHVEAAYLAAVESSGV